MRNTKTRRIVGVGAAIPAVFALCTSAHSDGWTSLAPGLDLWELKADAAAPVGDSVITIVRVDPQLWDLVLLSVTGTGGAAGGYTAEEWCRREGLVAATNAGMYQGDYKTHVGYMRCDGHVNCSKSNDYLSAAAFSPKRAGNPRFRLFDLDDTPLDSVFQSYNCVVQNLRLIKRPGRNRWSRQSNRWSEAALGEDKSGRVLLIFSRTPYPMHDLNEILLNLPIDLIASQHLEGGPEAQLFIDFGAVKRNTCGSYETGFNEDDHNRHAWPVPNIIGVRRRAPTDST